MRHSEITLPEGRLEAAWWGPMERAPTLVLLHEGLGSVGLWRDVPDRLAAATNLGVFAYSRFGYGRSAGVTLPRPLDYMRREAAILPRALGAAGIGDRVLIGHSDGASIAAIHAGTAHDRRLRALVLIAPHFFVEDITVAEIAAIRRDYAAGLRDRLARHHDDVDAAFSGWAGAWLDPGFPAAFDLRADLAGIRVPTLIVQGTDDPYGTDAHARLAERLAGARIALPAARHAPHLEATEAVVAEVAAFVAHLRPHPPRCASAG